MGEKSWATKALRSWEKILTYIQKEIQALADSQGKEKSIQNITPIT